MDARCATICSRKNLGSSAHRMLASNGFPYPAITQARTSSQAFFRARLEDLLSTETVRVVPAQQYSLLWKPYALRRRMNKFSELDPASVQRSRLV